MGKIDKQSLGFAVRDIRNQAKITADELGRLTGLTPTYIAKIENGRIAKPSFESIDVIAEALSTLDVVRQYVVNLNQYNPKLVRLIRSHLQHEEMDRAYKEERVVKFVKDAEQFSWLDEDEYNVFKKFGMYKQLSDTFKKQEDEFYSFMEIVAKKLDIENLDEYGVPSDKGKYDFVQSLSDSLNDKSVTEYRALEIIKRTINRKLKLLLEDRKEFRVKHSASGLCKDILRLWLLTLYKREDEPLFLDDEDED